MAEWERIEMSGNPDIQSDPDFPSMVVVSIPLKPQPSSAWVEIFQLWPAARSCRPPRTRVSEGDVGLGSVSLRPC